MNCKVCQSKEVVKNGKIRGKQRYYCKVCSKSFVEVDMRLKYSESIKLRAVVMALNNCGHRVIGRVLDIPYQYVGNWIKKYVEIIKSKMNSQEVQKKVEVIEVDELYTYVKKKKIKSGYGLLWIDTKVKLLILR